jgi:hypothetical protein
MLRRAGNGPWSACVGRFLAVIGSAVLLLAAPAYAGPVAGTQGIAGAARGAGSAPAHAVGPSAAANDSPAGFWYGTDSTTVPITGPAPYTVPVIGGPYGGYIGMAGNWATWQGCGTKVVWSATNSAQANTNFTTHKDGIGSGVYWFMGGPGVDPHYNGTTQEAYAWGTAQAERTRYDISHLTVKYPVVFMDIELPGHAPTFTPAPDNGWHAVYTSPCSGRVKASYVAPSLDRADFNGFWDYIKHDTSFEPGVYSAPGIWGGIFGTGSASSIPDTYEWTYTDDTSSLKNPPSGWCLPGTSTCAQFFGGMNSSSGYAVMWQWSGGGGTTNSYGDFDQIDANRQS